MRTRDPQKLFLRYRKRGDAAALGRVFDLVSPELLALGVHLVRDVSLAEDLVQETFLAAVEGADRYDEARPLVPWLVGILVNRARKARERIARAPRPTDLDDGPEPPDASSVDPARAAAAHEAIELVSDAVDALEEPYRSVVRSHVTDSLPPRDIALALGRAPGTVRVQLHRGLEQLRASLGGRATETFSGVGLAVPAAVKLGESGVAGLAAVRDVVVRSAASHATKMEVARATSTVPLIGGAAVCAAVAGVVAFQLAAPTASDGAAVDPLDLAPKPVVRENDVNLAELEAPIDDGIARRSREAVANGAAEADARERSEPETRSTRRETQRRPPALDDPIDFRLEAIVDLSYVPEIDPVRLTSLSVRSAAGERVGGTQGTLLTSLSAMLGSHPTALELHGADGAPLIARLDHPDALPVEVEVPVGAWEKHRGERVALASLAPRPIAARLRVTLDDRAQFLGRVRLRRIYDLSLVDAAGTDQDEIVLRLDGHSGDLMLLGLPERPTDAALLVLLDEARRGETTLDRPLRRERLEPFRVLVLDPFGEPMKDVAVRAAVPDDPRIVFRHEDGRPRVIDGHFIVLAKSAAQRLFATVQGRRARSTARELVGGSWGRQQAPLVAALPVIDTATDASGLATLEGVIGGVHGLQVESPLGDAVTRESIGQLQVEALGDEPHVVSAPLAGVEILPPTEIATSATGEEVWARATIVVAAGERTFGVERLPSGKARALVPSGVSLEIRASEGDERWRAKVPPLVSGVAAHVTLRPAGADQEDTADER
ncbi:MAG: RNA polymerase sigma factor [Planctomycetota bacterium]